MLKKINFNSGFSRNIFVLVTGTSIAQLLPALFTPVLSRLYSPEDFGLLALFMTIVTIAGTVSTGRYELAIQLPEKEEEARSLLRLSVRISLTVSILLSAIALIGRTQISIWLEKPELGTWLLAVPPTVFAIAVGQAYYSWFNRKRKYKLLSASKLTQSATLVIIQIACGLWVANFAGLIAGFSISYLIYLALFAYLYFSEKRDEESGVTSLRSAAIKYKDFPLINNLQAIMDLARVHGVIFLVLYYFSAEILGQYSMTYRILALPVTLVGMAVNHVFYQQASTMKRNGDNLIGLFQKTVGMLLLIGLPFFTIIILAGPWIFAFVLGEEWREAGRMARYLSPWLFLTLLSSPVSSIPLIYRKQSFFFMIATVGTVLGLAVFVLASKFTSDISITLGLFSLTMALHIGLYLFLMYRLIRKK